MNSRFVGSTAKISREFAPSYDFSPFFFFFPLLARFPTHLLLIFFFLSLPRFLARSMLIRSIYFYEFVLSLFLSRMKIDRENSSRDKFPGVFR